MSDVYFPKETPVARKPHTCEMCLFPVDVGSRYVIEKGVYEGSFYARRLHEKCSAILDAFMAESWESEFDYDWIFEWLQQRFCDGCACESICIDYETSWRELGFSCPRIARAFAGRSAV